MFASSVKSTVEIGEVSVIIRKLSARSLEKAADARQGAAVASAKQFGAEMLKALQDVKTPDAGAIVPAAQSLEAQRKGRYNLYDRASVLTAGVVSWTGPDTLPELAAGIQDLDEGTAQQLHEAILDLSLPPIDPAVAEGKG
jgi:hypothetical protein